MTKLFFLLTLLPLSAAAADPIDIAPVLKCPAVPEAFSKMITQLKVLKTAIKQEAACGPLNAEVESLETLLGKRRDEVTALIDKSKTEALSQEEHTLIRKYVEDVTKKVMNTAELFNRNNYCFIEDKKKLSFSDLASITLDATALAKTVAGPWATPIALGGTALAGIFQGLNTVVQTNRGYDFTKLEQRQSYVQSLCAYYNYRQDIDYLLYPQKRTSQLRNLEGALTSNLKGVLDNCPECNDLSKKVIVSLKDKSKDSAPVNAAAAEINAAYVRPLGTYTVKSLATLQWIDGEISRIREDSDENANIGRDFLSEAKADMDRFLFDNQAPEFVKFQTQKSYDLFREFSSYVKSESYALIAQSVGLGQGKWVDTTRMNEAEMIAALNQFQEIARTNGQTGLAARILQFQSKSLELYDRTRLAAGVTETYCAFFQRAGVYTSNLQYACEGTVANTVRRNLQRLANSNAVPQPALDGVPPVEYVTDWADSLAKVVQRINQDPNKFKKKNEFTPR